MQCCNGWIMEQQKQNRRSTQAHEGEKNTENKQLKTNYGINERGRISEPAAKRYNFHNHFYAQCSMEHGLTYNIYRCTILPFHRLCLVCK